MTQKTTRRGITQTENAGLENKKGNIPQCVSGSFTHAVTKQPALKMPGPRIKTVRGGTSGNVPVRQYPCFTKTNGFTLIELLVTVLIIGVLSAVALPQYQKAVRKAQSREILNSINALDKGLANYYLEHGNFSKQVGSTRTMIGAADLDIEIPELKYSKYKTTDGQNPIAIEANKLGEYFYRQGSDYSTPYVTFVLPDKETTLRITWRNGKRYGVDFRGDIGKYFSTKTVSVGTAGPRTVLNEPALTVN